MSLYIRDKAVDALAREVQVAIEAPTKTAAVRIALENELARTKAEVPLRKRVRKFQNALRSIGPNAPDFDMNKFMDESWGDV